MCSSDLVVMLGDLVDQLFHSAPELIAFVDFHDVTSQVDLDDFRVDASLVDATQGSGRLRGLAGHNGGFPCLTWVQNLHSATETDQRADAGCVHDIALFNLLTRHNDSRVGMLGKLGCATGAVSDGLDFFVLFQAFSNHPPPLCHFFLVFCVIIRIRMRI